MFKLDERYTRDEIHDQVGGSQLSYLPTKNCIITCICLSKKKNPDAPHVILAGDGKRNLQSAKWLAGQTSELPVFLKESSNNWIYKGLFQGKEISHG